MNDNLKNYKVDPDPKVWKNIAKANTGAKVRSQSLAFGIGAALVASAIVGVIVWPYSEPVVEETPAQANVLELELQSVTDNQVSEAIAFDNVGNNCTEVSRQTKIAAAANPVREQVASVPVEQIAPALASAASEAASVAEVTRHEAATVAPKSAPKVVQQPVAEPAKETAVEEKAAQPAKAKASAPTSSVDTIVWVPNIFAPASGDPDLQTFRARLSTPDASISNFKMTIFNRSGHLVFSSMDINTSWDGTFKGRQLPQGAYVYVLYYSDKDGFRHQRKGSVVLVR